MADRQKKYLGKIIKVVLLNGFRYNGKCVKEEGQYITIIDRYNSEVKINTGEIKVLESREVSSNEF